jgi:hypothetical protein
VVIGALRSDYDTVKKTALTLLGKIGRHHPEVIPNLRAVAQDHAQEFDLRHHALGALSRLRTTSAAECVLSLLAEYIRDGQDALSYSLVENLRKSPIDLIPLQSTIVDIASTLPPSHALRPQLETLHASIIQVGHKCLRNFIDAERINTLSVDLAANTDCADSAGAMLDVRLDIGWRPLFELDFYQPISYEGGFFVNPLLSLDRYQVPVRVGDEEIAEYQRSRITGGAGVGHRLGKSGEIQIGARRGNGDFKRQVGDPSLREGSYQIGNYFGQINFDSRDTPDFARKGTLFDFEVARNTEILGSSEDFTQLQGSFQQPISFGANTIALSTDYGVSFQTIDPGRVFILGGMFDLAGYQPGGLAASDFVVGRITYYRELASAGGPLARLNLFGGGSFEMASLRSDLELIHDNTGIVAGMLFVGADTPIVPLYFAAGINNDDEASFYLNIGRIFRPRR